MGLRRENREEGVILKERVKDQTRESHPKTESKKNNKRHRGRDSYKEELKLTGTMRSGCQQKRKKTIKQAEMALVRSVSQDNAGDPHNRPLLLLRGLSRPPHPP